MARYSDEDLRDLYRDVLRSRDQGVSGLYALIGRVWDIDQVDWAAVKKVLAGLSSGRAVARRMEALPHFKEVAAGRYDDVVDSLDDAGEREFVEAWEGFARRHLAPVEDEWVDVMMRERVSMDGNDIAKELVGLAREAASPARDVIPFEVSRDLTRMGMVATGAERVGPSIYVSVRNQSVSRSQMKALLGIPSFRLVGGAGRGLELMFDV